MGRPGVAAGDTAALCAARHAAVLPHLGTVNVARDLEEIRRALGDAGLTYVGFSYGTLIGAVYAELFPTRVRALVLDGVVDPARSSEDLALAQAHAFEQAFDRWSAWCARACCAFKGGEDPAAAYNRLRARVEATPIPAVRANRPAGPAELEMATIGALYADATWPMLAIALASADTGDGSAVVQLADLFVTFRNPVDGTYPNIHEANAAVNCLDQAVVRDRTTFRATAARVAAAAPRFGRSI